MFAAFTLCTLILSQDKIPESVPITEIIANLDKYEGKTVNVSGWGFFFEVSNTNHRIAIRHQNRTVGLCILNEEKIEASLFKLRKTNEKNPEKLIIQGQCVGARGGRIVEFRDCKLLYNYGLSKP